MQLINAEGVQVKFTSIGKFKNWNMEHIVGGPQVELLYLKYQR